MKLKKIKLNKLLTYGVSILVFTVMVGCCVFIIAAGNNDKKDITNEYVKYFTECQKNTSDRNVCELVGLSYTLVNNSDETVKRLFRKRVIPITRFANVMIYDEKDFKDFIKYSQKHMIKNKENSYELCIIIRDFLFVLNVTDVPQQVCEPQPLKQNKKPRVKY